MIFPEILWSKFEALLSFFSKVRDKNVATFGYGVGSSSTFGFRKVDGDTALPSIIKFPPRIWAVGKLDKPPQEISMGRFQLYHICTHVSHESASTWRCDHPSGVQDFNTC
jgi:hypothetical protein